MLVRGFFILNFILIFVKVSVSLLPMNTKGTRRLNVFNLIIINIPGIANIKLTFSILMSIMVIKIPDQKLEH